MSSREVDFEMDTETRFAHFWDERRRAEKLLVELLEEEGPDVPFFKLKKLVRRLGVDEPWPLTAALLAVARRVDLPWHTVELAQLALQAAARVRLPEAAKQALFLEAEALLGDGLRELNRHKEAERAFARAARYQRQVTDPEVCGLYCYFLARLREDQGRSEEALALLQRAACLFEEVGQIEAAAQVLLDKAGVELRRCGMERYLVDLQAVIGLVDKGLSADQAAVAVGVYGIELQGRGRVKEALGLLDAFWARYPKFGAPAERAELSLLEGTLLMSVGRQKKAEQRLKEALRYFLQWSDSTSAMRASLSLALLLLREGGREGDLKTLAQESLRPLGRALSMPRAARVALRKFFAAVESGTATASEASALLEVAGFMSEKEITEPERKGGGGRK